MDSSSPQATKSCWSDLVACGCPIHRIFVSCDEWAFAPRAAFEWYLDLRRYGSVPHAGFGMGIEPLVAWLCGLGHVRETIPFARTLNRIYP